MKVTEDVISAYFNQKVEYASRIKNLNNPYLYAYEEKLGKCLFDFSPSEIVDMLSTFKIGSENNQRPQSVTTLRQTKSQIKNLFTFYSNNYRATVNPIDTNEFREAFEKMLSDRTEIITNEDVENIISLIYENNSIDRGTITECIIRLCVDGCEGGMDIIRIKKHMIDFDKCIINLPHKRVILQQRTLMLLQSVNEMTSIVGRYEYEMGSWNGSYFKLPTRNPDEFDKKSQLEMSRKINAFLSQCFANDPNMPILKYQDFYLLGIYNRFASEYGYDGAEDVIVKNSRNRVNDFMRIMAMYGLPYTSMTNYKRRLKAYFSK